MRIFITGGAGFVGSAIMRRPQYFSPEDVEFTVYSRDEVKHAKIRGEFPSTHFILGDVRDIERLQLAMRGHDVVIHAGAMKHVVMGESNVWETCAVNIDGSRNVAQAACHTGVGRLIGISTDKACQPVNIYGMTKLVMERLFQEADRLSDTQINVVRYGNVISSSGSVIPLFRKQAREGKITLTNPDMTRFWLSVDYAVELIAMAVREKAGGSILIPRLGSANMVDVVKAAIAVEFGYGGDLLESVAKDIEQEVIGQRFGEKVHEGLLGAEETVYAYPGKVMRLMPVVDGPVEDHVEYRYTSNTPDHLIDTAEMVEMIQEEG